MQEHTRMLAIMEAQQTIGVEVRWILKDELLKNRIVAERIKDLGTFDVSIVDDSWLLRIFLTSKRKYTHAEAIRDGNLVEKANFVFAEAFEAGNSM